MTQQRRRRLLPIPPQAVSSSSRWQSEVEGHSTRSGSSSNKRSSKSKLLFFFAIQCMIYWEYQYLYRAVITMNPNASNNSNSTALSDNNIQKSYRYKYDALPPPPLQIGTCHNLTWWQPHSHPQYQHQNCQDNSNSNKNKNSDENSPLPVTHHNKPVWVASFPGSGAEMFRLLVESITGGMPGWSIYDSDHPAQTNGTCLSVHAATCKTHWPVLRLHPPPAPPTIMKQPLQHESSASAPDHEYYDSYPYHPYAMVLLRNPAKAFPSRLNHQWEINNKAGFHSQQAPERAWNRWIAHSLQGQMDKYKELILTWTNTPNRTMESLSLPPPPSVALFVPYEGLTSWTQGAHWTEQVANVLRSANSRVAQSFEDLECLWKSSMFEHPTMKRAEHTYQPGYTAKQHAKLVRMMDELLELTQEDRPDVWKILQGYRISIVNDTRIIVHSKQKNHKPGTLSTTRTTSAEDAVRVNTTTSKLDD